MTKSNLNPNIIAKAKEKFEERKEIEIVLDVDGEESRHTLEIVTRSTQTRRNRLISDYIETLMEIRKRNERLMHQSLEVIFTYMLIKHYTNMETPNTFEEQIILINNMMDLGMIEQVMSEFETKEIEMLFEQINEVQQRITNNADELEKALEEEGEDDANENESKEQQ